MLVVGLTGGIASGKTVVASLLAKKGALVIDADEIAHKLVQPQKPAWQDVVEFFGKKILNDDGTLNRSLLAKLVFNDQELRLQLEKIIHPRVQEEISDLKKKLELQAHESVLILDIPLLIETGMHKTVDLVVVVTADEEIQIRRLQERDDCLREEALERIRAQMPLSEKIGYADYVIENSGNMKETIAAIDRLWEKFKKNLQGC